jgi:hypothetical protein
MRRKRIQSLLLRSLPFLLLGLLTTIGMAMVLAATVDIQQGQQLQAQAYDGDDDWIVSRWDRGGAVLLRSQRMAPGSAVAWSPQQAAGAPDTPGPGDQHTAWASQSQDAGTEWLVLDYLKPVTPREVHVYENYCPGALSRVTIFDEQGQEIEAWSGTDPTPTNAGAGISKVPVWVNTKTKRVKIYLASDKVPGWNEIDAVGLVSDTGEVQWARRVMASTTYASAVRNTVNSMDPTLLVPGWSGLQNRVYGEPGITEDRLVDARGWPLLALKSDRDIAELNLGTNNTAANNAANLGMSGNFTGSRLNAYSGTVALNMSGTSFGPTPIPLRPVWIGLVGDTLIWATVWAILWVSFTLPRRFVRECGRVRSGACIRCGYDLGYDFQSGCPECGWRRDRAAVATRLVAAQPANGDTD